MKVCVENRDWHVNASDFDQDIFWYEAQRLICKYTANIWLNVHLVAD